MRKIFKILLISFLYFQMCIIYNVWLHYEMITFFIFYLNIVVILSLVYIKKLENKIKKLEKL